MVLDRPRGVRLEDIVVEGAGVGVKGSVEIDKDGEVTASFPNFGFSDGDKASLRLERTPEGVPRLTLRGDVYDGRGFIKAFMSNAPHPEKQQQKLAARELELDIKVGAIAGFNGEALRAVDLKVARRAGQIRAFSLSAKLGRDATLLGELRPATGRHVLYMETNDAGALARFTDTYPKILGGHLWVTMDPPSADASPQQGVLNVRQFRFRGEPALDRMAASGGGEATGFGGAHARANPQSQSTTTFSHLQFEFTRTPGRLGIKDGVVFGDAIGATLEGVLDYAQDRVRMRGMFVPLYGLNNMFVHLPLVGPILGGENEGLLGVTYEVLGSPHSPNCVSIPCQPLRSGRCANCLSSAAMRQRTPSPPNCRPANSWNRTILDGSKQDVPLLSERQFDDPLRGQVRRGQRHLVIAHRHIIDPQATAPNLPARLAGRGHQTGPNKRMKDAEARGQLGPANLDRRQCGRQPALLKGGAGSCCRLLGCSPTMQKRGRFRGEYFLGLIEFLT